MRGFAAIGLHRPKTPENIGSAMRALGCYGGSLAVISGERGLRCKEIAEARTDTMKAWKHIPVLTVPDVFDGLPIGSTPVAVDLVNGAISLPYFAHPERAFYIFGPEDGTLDGDIVSKCSHKVFIPTTYCMNLAATVNVVLYSRCVQRGFPKTDQITTQEQ